MPVRGVALTVQYVAWDTVANAGKTGDGGNHTLRCVGDGAEFTPGGVNATAPVEVDAANLKGVYKLAIAAGENAYDVVTLGGKSSTSGVAIIPITWTNTISADVNTVKGQAVTCAAPVTVTPNVGTTQPVQFTGTGAAALVKATTPGTSSGVVYGPMTAPSQAGMTNVQIKLDAGASALDQVYQWNVISILSGTDAGDSAIITDYNGTTKIATVNSTWTVQPDATSVFQITPTAQVQVSSYAAGQAPATPALIWSAATRTLTDKVGYGIDLTQTLAAPRALDAVADASLNVNDALHSAIASAAGKEAVVGTAYSVMTPSTGTVLRSFTLDSATSPTSRS